MTQDQVEEVKQKTDIVSLVSEYIDLKKAGSNYKALCPFHSEKTPSFLVSPELQIFKCFGCGESGDAIAFLQKYEGMDFPEALKFLADRSGVKLEPLTPGKSSEKQRLFQINIYALNFYNYLLLRHPVGKPAFSYLTKSRGLAPETIKKFQLGFSPVKPNALKTYLVDKKKIHPRDLERVGLVYTRQGKAFDRFAGRIVFPLHDHRGNMAGFAGRLLPNKRTSDLAKYINTPETPVYSKARMLYGLNKTRGDIKKTRSAVVVEGELDMISSWQVGVKNVVAIKGSALTSDQARLLARFAEKLTLALDADIAGDTAARRGIEVAEDAGLEVRVARLGSFKDPDEAARKKPDEYKRALDNAVGVWDFIVESIFSRHDETKGMGKARISREVVPVIASISDKIVQAHYVERVAKRLSVPSEAVASQVESFDLKEESQKPKIEGVVLPKAKSRREMLEERLMGLSFQTDPTALLKRKIYSLIKTPLAKRILVEYKDFAKKVKVFNPSEFAESLPKELVDGFAEMILKDTKGPVDSEESIKKELNLVVHELEIFDIKEKLREAALVIRDLEKEGQKAKLKKEEEKFGRLTSNLAELEGRELRGIIHIR